MICFIQELHHVLSYLTERSIKTSYQRYRESCKITKNYWLVIKEFIIWSIHRFKSNLHYAFTLFFSWNDLTLPEFCLHISLFHSADTSAQNVLYELRFRKVIFLYILEYRIHIIQYQYGLFIVMSAIQPNSFTDMFTKSNKALKPSKKFTLWPGSTSVSICSLKMQHWR